MWIKPGCGLRDAESEQWKTIIMYCDVKRSINKVLSRKWDGKRFENTCWETVSSPYTALNIILREITFIMLQWPKVVSRKCVETLWKIG